MPDQIPTLQVLATRHIYDPVVAPHILTFINQAMEYPYMKDLLSDYMTGVILYTVSTGVIRQYHGRLFQLPIVDVGKGLGIPMPLGLQARQHMGTLSVRVGLPHAGQPFLDPDGLPLTFDGFLLIPRSPYTFYNLDTHPNYAAWVSTHLWNGGPPNTPSAHISMNNERKDDRHKSPNLLPYTPGPLSVPQPPGYAAHFPYKRPPGVKFVLVRELQMAAQGPLLPIGGLPPALPPPPPAPVVIDFSSSSSSYSSSYSSSLSSSDSSPDEEDENGGGGGGGGGEDEPVVVISLGGEETAESEVVPEEEVVPKEDEVVPEESDSHEGNSPEIGGDQPNEGKLPEIVDSPAQGQRLKRGPYRYHKEPAKRRAYRMDM